MEKYGVEKDPSKTKTAGVTVGKCPQCGGKLTEDDRGRPTEHCPNCGTEPFEKGKER